MEISSHAAAFPPLLFVLICFYLPMRSSSFRPCFFSGGRLREELEDAHMTSIFVWISG